VTRQPDAPGSSCLTKEECAITDDGSSANWYSLSPDTKTEEDGFNAFTRPIARVVGGVYKGTKKVKDKFMGPLDRQVEKLAEHLKEESEAWANKITKLSVHGAFVKQRKTAEDAGLEAPGGSRIGGQFSATTVQIVGMGAAGAVYVAYEAGKTYLLNAAGDKIMEFPDAASAKRYLAQNGQKVEPFALHNKTHRHASPVPRGVGPGGGKLQSHHPLQQQWAKENLGGYGYDPHMAPTITIETGEGFAHSIISARQSARRDARVAAGRGKWSSTLQEELGYTVEDLRAGGFSDDSINKIMAQQYKMLDKIGVPYEPIALK
jgi:hypothetical protein